MSSGLGLNRIDELLKEVGGRKHPPVHLWQPSRTGEIDIKIDAEGAWFHEGRKIHRQGLVRIFASILRYEAPDYYLVTPQERLRITVADVPFVGIDVDSPALSDSQLGSTGSQAKKSHHGAV